MYRRQAWTAVLLVLRRCGWRTLGVLSCLLLPTAQAHAELNVVATSPVVAAIAQTIGGPRVLVSSLTSGGSDPHYAVAKPSMIRRLHRADLLLLIGAELEVGWLPAAVGSARNRAILPGSNGRLNLSNAVTLLGVETDAGINRARGDVHAAGNPHYWLDPHNGRLMARAVSERLGLLDPPGVGAYATQLQSFERELDVRVRTWRSRLGPLQGKAVIAYHSSFDYLAHAFGFSIVAYVEPLPGIAPTAAHLNSLIDRIETESIGLLIMEPFYERRSARLLQQRTGIRLAVAPTSVGARPDVATYFELFDAIVETLLNPRGSH